MKRYLVVVAAVALLLGPGGTAFANGIADVIFVVDESGSMDTEHAWLKDMVDPLDQGLTDAGISGKYGLVGFGGSSPHYYGHKHLVGGGDFGTPAEFKTAVNGLVLTGGTEDGWDGIDTALNDYTFDSGAAINVILVTDEDRDNVNSSLSYASVLADLTGNDALLNTAIDCDLEDGSGNAALGVDADGNAYIADGSGGYTTATGGVLTYGYGNSENDYADMAWATGAAVWDLNKLRAGGLTAESFTEAFVAIKVEEIEEQVVPEPVTMAGLLMAVGCLGGYIRRRRTG